MPADHLRDAPSFELGDVIHDEIKRFCAAGDQLADQKKYEEALGQYTKAWELVPEPKSEWEASTWILAAVGDSCFLSGYFSSALEALEYAMHCPNAIGNPFLHLRLGQVLFEKEQLDRAADELIRAYMGAGDEIFLREDPKYIEFLRTRAIL